MFIEPYEYQQLSSEGHDPEASGMRRQGLSALPKKMFAQSRRMPTAAPYEIEEPLRDLSQQIQ
jgi:hypothetical protein